MREEAGPEIEQSRQVREDYKKILKILISAQSSRIRIRPFYWKIRESVDFTG